MFHTSSVSLVPCHVRHLPEGAIELMPIVLPMTLTAAQRRSLAAILLEGLDDAPAGAELCLA
ncbi:hypothetical protein [Nonomuraea cavernae]|uniref:hypothetical protein n=1 Tax=Nonomuraea cavernae TaxID=2045107 RepID=UPI0033FE169B